MCSEKNLWGRQVQGEKGGEREGRGVGIDYCPSNHAQLIIRLLDAVVVMLPRALMAEVAITSAIQISLFICNSGFLLD